MRAIHYDRQGAADDVLILGDLPTPAPQAGEVLVRVHMSGINPTDVKARTGFSSAMPYERVIPHQDGAGVIEAVGRGVPATRIGERVWIFEAQSGRAAGTAADYVVVPCANAVQLPANTSYEIGASLGIPGLTAHRCLFADGDLKGRWVLVHGGAGVVGSAAIHLAKWAGALVATTVLEPQHEAIARGAGADLVLNLRGDDVAARIREATAGKGVDRIVDVNLVANLDLDLACLANGGVISSYAMRDATDERSIPLLRAMIAGAVFRFVYIYTVPLSAKQAAIVDLTASLEAEAYKPAIGLIVPLHRTADAHIALEQGAVTGKVLVRVVD
ncbi:NADPH2:quinone reductase [Rhizobium tibeticum]|uniref:Alcohol dehydrogenase n=1 Tax=Rhizobium tibeticum TaxID=501024 RepID=A0A1H8TDT4_9HYPH|nr:NADPH:quinone reductase [Rhizobium tibeticum]SEI14884.1 Alcohol dehydrogenase [Rhizobium tibeticum]SEO89097.1 NADPH2:quinone reductase [Rhizobium tibeticum]